VTGDFTDGSQIICRLNGRSPVRLRVTSVRPGPAIDFEALEGPFAAPADVPAVATAQATTTRQVIPRLTPGCSSSAPAASTPTPSGYQAAAC